MQTLEKEKKIFELSSYKLPDKNGNVSNILRLYPAVPRKTDRVKFDIYDYEMLFADEGTKRLIREGDTIGCFYIESPGMRSLLKKLNVDTFEMLTAASSIIRPGVAESGMMKEFIERHHNPARRKYLVPRMEEFLGDTYGVMIYQEDVIKVAHHIAGLSLEEADLLRRAMSGKMRSPKAINQLEDRFMKSATLQGLSKYQAGELWRQIASFAGYAFCKAHSASFALLSFQVAFLKVHYPAEFLAAVLSNGGGYYSPAVYIQEAKRKGIKIELPSVNESIANYTGRDKVIIIGLMAIKNLPKTTIDIIIEERSSGGLYKSLADFLARTQTGYEDAAKLIKCGAMDCFGETRPTLMRLLDIYTKKRKILEMHSSDLFFDEIYKTEVELNCSIDYSDTEKCRIELEMFDYMITKHPLDFFEEWINVQGVISSIEMSKYNGKKVKMLGWYMTSKRVRTSKGEIMKFLSLEDKFGTFEAVIFPKIYSVYADLTLSMGPFIVEGKVDAVAGSNIIVDKLEVLTNMKLNSIVQKDSVENNYYGDEEKFSENEIALVNSLDTEKLRLAYLGKQKIG